jgi:uncharacterized protein YprB with RNaseH-like and TPR domain
MARSLQDRLREVQERGRVETEQESRTAVNVGPGLRRGDERTNGQIDNAGSEAGAGSGSGSGAGAGGATSLKARLQALIDQQTRRREREHHDANTESDLQTPYEIDPTDTLDGPANYETWLAARNRSRSGGSLGRTRASGPPPRSPFNQPRADDEWNYGLEGPPEDLTKLIGAEIITTPHGEYLQRDAVFRLDARVGRASIEKLVRALPDAARILTASMNLIDFDPRKAAFIDTETTGLSGGAGTAAFLVALGFIDGDAFIVRQYFMRDFHEERALIRAVESDLERFDTIVSFNGKQFDVPLLESRFRLQRRVFRQIERHLDMLHPGRRLWKARLESCSLQSLERGVLGFHREDDIPGAFIPERYFEYLRKRDGRLMAPVMEHNLQDIVSLAVLTGEALAMVSEPGALPDDAFDILSLGKVLERAEMDERSEEVYRVIAETGTGRARTDATVRLAYRAKARKLHDEAERLWRAAVALASAVAHRELAMLLEHTRRNRAEALRIVDDGLDLVTGRSDFASLEDDLLKRRSRLARVRQTKGGK